MKPRNRSAIGVVGRRSIDRWPYESIVAAMAAHRLAATARDVVMLPLQPNSTTVCIVIAISICFPLRYCELIVRSNG